MNIDIAVHPLSGKIYMTGYAPTVDFPVTTNAAQQVYGGAGDSFAAVFNAGLTSIETATYIGGNGVDSIQRILFHPTNG